MTTARIPCPVCGAKLLPRRVVPHMKDIHGAGTDDPPTTTTGGGALDVRGFPTPAPPPDLRRNAAFLAAVWGGRLLA